MAGRAAHLCSILPDCSGDNIMDKKTFLIGVLSLSAVILLAANFLAPRGVVASEAIQDNDYSLQTAKAPAGGDAVYVTDKRTGLMAVFVFSPQQKALIVSDVVPVQTAFAKMKESKRP
jgi:hypothetical protein